MSSNLLPGKQLVSVLFTAAILLGAFVVLSPFVLAILWAAILAVATWPVHEWIVTRLEGRRGLAAAASTTLVLIFLVGPMALLLVLLSQDIYTAASFLIAADTYGKPVPAVIANFPIGGDYLTQLWEQYLAHPKRLSGVLEAQLDVIRNAAQTVFLDLTSRLATLLFALWVLYFFYQDGKAISAWVNQIGYKWLEYRWPSYVFQLPDALRAAVNGIVIVGFGEALLLSLLLWVCGVPSAVTLGVVSAVIAFIPLAAPLLFAIIAFMLFAVDAVAAGVAVFVIGTVIVMAADYVVRPVLIQGGTALPFLAILFGIFGGVGTMGIVGLIIGPVLLVLLLVLFREAAIDERSIDLDLTQTMKPYEVPPRK
ncbi:MAG: AI-2E family transporter [Burkholderiales bacterium]|nr:AI-2E family transporter [Burkholderiales bacterium]